MKNALILHGGDNNSKGNWFPWLKEELVKKGYKVWLPDLPNDSHPDKNEWLKFVFSNSKWQFNEESIIVGHSAGATLILRILESLPVKTKIDKAILVAGYVTMGTVPMAFKYKVHMVDSPFDYQKIRQKANQFYFICSDNDPYSCGLEESEIMHKRLGGKLFLEAGQGHFNLEVGKKYLQFPKLLNLV